MRTGHRFFLRIEIVVIACRIFSRRRMTAINSDAREFFPAILTSVSIIISHSCVLVFIVFPYRPGSKKIKFKNLVFSYENN